MALRFSRRLVGFLLVLALAIDGAMGDPGHVSAAGGDIAILIDGLCSSLPAARAVDICVSRRDRAA